MIALDAHDNYRAALADTLPIHPAGWPTDANHRVEDVTGFNLVMLRQVEWLTVQEDRRLLNLRFDRWADQFDTAHFAANPHFDDVAACPIGVDQRRVDRLCVSRSVHRPPVPLPVWSGAGHDHLLNPCVHQEYLSPMGSIMHQMNGSVPA
jgi:hypothetical protein